MLIRIKDEHLRSVYHNVPRILFEFFQAHSLKEKYLFFYFNEPYISGRKISSKNHSGIQ